jgi:hypothetical protein
MPFQLSSLRTVFILLFLCYSISGFGQYGSKIQLDSISLADHPDSLYREDQIYFGLTFNAMADLPTGVDQSGFSGGIHAGFIRDMPFNQQRNWSFGAGLGFSMNVYNNTLFIGEDNNENTVFKAIDESEIDFTINRFSTFLVEAPLQIRWRTSTSKSYSFWRIYTGLKIGYIYYFKSRFKQTNNEVIQTKLNADLNRLRYGATFTFGYNSFNFHVYYSLNSFFDGQISKSTENVGMSTFKIGLMFYIF